jgi:two-component system chemotaxis response regulator CheB
VAQGAPVRLVAVAASTGGPAALLRILSSLPGDLTVPILVVQHIATGFVAGLADWLSASCNLRVKVAEHGEPLLKRTVYLAPDERQLGVGPDGRVVVAEAAAVNGFRPSGTYLFASAAQAYGASVAAVILTGMGSDGVEGLKAVKAAGGRVLAQDEASSVVYGMPGEAAAAGVVDAVLSVEEIAPRLAELIAGGNDADARTRR